MSQYTIDNCTKFSGNKNSFNVQNNYIAADDRSQILDWLSLIELQLRHRDIQERRVDNVGKWLLETGEFRGWYESSGEDESDKAVLFCYGGPGVGKTFISSLIVDWLRGQASGQKVAVGCFYFDFAAREGQSVTNVLGSLLKQVVGREKRIPEEISRALREQMEATGGEAPGLPDIVKMLQAITSSLRTFICIDALDECAAVHRVKILNSLQQILQKSPGTRIFITGRPHVRAEVEARVPRQVASVSVSPSEDDIIGYLRVRLDEDVTPDAMDESLVTDILEMIPKNVSEMFLLVSMNIDAILNESTIRRRRAKLRKMKGGLELGDVYGATIERIKAQDGDKSSLGMVALMWVSHAERPLKADELCHVLAVELGSTNFDSDNVPSVSTLVGCCQGLITVDKETSTVRLMHFTLQEYLSAHPEIFNTPHSVMAEICLTYLNSQQVKALSTPSPVSRDAAEDATQNIPFLEYSSVYWGVHAKKELTDSAKSLALEVLKENYGPISTKLLLVQDGEFYLGGQETFIPFSGLHCASFFGIVEVVAALIEMGCYDINEGDFLGCTPLAWATRNGHEEVVKALLGREEVNPDKPDNDGRTPLSFAAGYGREGVVKALLGREEVNPDRPDGDGRTPLSFAAGYGREGVVKMLLGRDEVNPDKPDNDGKTPLWKAARYGHERVVKILLGREEVNPDKPNNDGGTPLSDAAWKGHEGVVKMLLGREEVNPDKPNNYGLTPLSFAAWDGHEGVVKMLLEREEVNPDKPCAYGRTPLGFAVWFGHEGVVKILLGREEVNPDNLDNEGQTPHSLAARSCNQKVVTLLQSRKAVTSTPI